MPIPRWPANAIAFDESRIPAVVQAMKEWVARDAERAGPCWGDVPPVPRDHAAAVLDAAYPLDRSHNIGDPGEPGFQNGWSNDEARPLIRPGAQD